MKLSQAELSRRLDYLNEVKDYGAPPLLFDQLNDFATFELFQYHVQHSILAARGIGLDTFPTAQEAKTVDIERMKSLFESFLGDTTTDLATIFDGCFNVRDKIARLTSLTEGELLLITSDFSVEFAVRKYATGILHGSMDDLHKILDQALGKPMEQRLTVTKDVSNLSQLSFDELQELLALSAPVEGEIVEESEEEECIS